MMKKIWIQIIFVLLASALSCMGQDHVDGFIARTFRSGVRRTMPYRLFIPPNYDRAQRYPMILWLHGAGGAGSDNIAQIKGDQVPGTHLWTSSASQAKNPAFVVVPQSGGSWTASGRTMLSQEMQMVLDIVALLQAEYSIDPARLYVLGQSDGAFGVWSVITNKPELFAAAVSLCGGGNPSYAGRVAKMPIWLFHGERDGTVLADESRKMVDAIKRAGGNPRYTEYKNVGHEIWERVFAEPELPEWLFAQHK